MTYADDREALLDQMNRRHRAMLRASEWAKGFVDIAPQSGCHLAALALCLRADREWREAEDALEDLDYDEDGVRRDQGMMVANLILAHRQHGPSDAEVDAALERMDHLLGPGWLEAAE